MSVTHVIYHLDHAQDYGNIHKNVFLLLCK
jgi:hypothetical protein